MEAREFSLEPSHSIWNRQTETVVACGSLLRVTGLSLGRNGLRGEMPFDPSNLPGEIPLELSALTYLEVLDLGLNDMSGAIPGGLSPNSFTGTMSGVPTEAGAFGFEGWVRDSVEGRSG